MRTKYNVYAGVTKIKSQTLKYTNRFTIGLISALAAIGVVAIPATSAAPGNGHNTLHGDSGYTTLDACGYFSGIQTASNGSTTTNKDGSVTTEEHGTWVGVYNDGTDHVTTSPVASLGNVQGAFTENQTTDTSGVTNGTETFTSNAGKVTQTYEYGPSVPGGFVVSVTGTRDLSFLTSNTNGECYTGQFPRP